jgi:Co/Zn/Cd efflux system component
MPKRSPISWAFLLVFITLFIEIIYGHF